MGEGLQLFFFLVGGESYGWDESCSCGFRETGFGGLKETDKEKGERFIC